MSTLLALGPLRRTLHLLFLLLGQEVQALQNRTRAARGAVGEVDVLAHWGHGVDHWVRRCMGIGRLWAFPWPCAASWWRQVRAPCVQSLRCLAERVHGRSAQCCAHGWSGRVHGLGPRHQRGEVCGRCGASPPQQRSRWRAARGATLISDALSRLRRARARTLMLVSVAITTMASHLGSARYASGDATLVNR